MTDKVKIKETDFSDNYSLEKKLKNFGSISMWIGIIMGIYSIFFIEALYPHLDSIIYDIIGVLIILWSIGANLLFKVIANISISLKQN